MMKNSNNKFNRFFAVILAALMLISALPLSSLAIVDTVVDEEEKLQQLYTFNNAVNKIKKDKPSFIYVKKAGISEDESITTSSKVASEISDEAKKYLTVLLDSLFNPERGIVKNLFNAIAGEETDLTSREIPKGVDSKYLVPKQGKDYVSGLTTDDYVTVKKEEIRDRLHPEKDKDVVRFEFQKYDLETAKGSPLEKVFDLPSGSLDPVIIGGIIMPDDDPDHPLSEVKFEDFTFHNAFVQAEYSTKGELIKYSQNISYTFSLSFYDAMRILQAYTKLDIMSIGLAIANPILKNTGNPELEAKDVLKNTLMFVQYDIKTEMGNFDWAPRFFGDADNNGKIDAYDARAILRHSVGIDEMEDLSDQVYSDVDFDGVISASDARASLRMSVGLNKKFDKVPEGEKIKIVEILPPKPPEPPAPPVPPVEPDPDKPDKPDINLPDSEEVAESLENFVNAIFDVINGIKGDGVTSEGITGLIKEIQDIIAGIK